MRQALSPRLLTSAVLLATALGGLPGAGAAELDTHGWWWRPQTGQGAALPPPPYVPSEGLAVGRNPAGPTAVAAVRFALAEGEQASVLSLQVAEVLPGSTVGLVACPAGGRWFGVQAGAWDTQPAAACDKGSVPGRPSTDGTSWTFDLSAAGGTSDVVVLPAPGATSPFEIAFDKPGRESLATVSRPASGSDPGLESSGREAESPTFFYDPAAAERFSAAPAAPSFTAAPAPPTAAPDGDVGSASPAPAPRFALPTTAPQPTGDPRRLAVFVLLGAVAAAAALRQEPLRPPRLLGPMAGGVSPPEPSGARGLGRFRQPRQGEPASLR